MEVKRVWSGPNFPWDSVQLPERKKKFTEGTRRKIEFWLLNRELTHAVIINGKDVGSSSLVAVPTSMGVRDELFFQVPIGKCRIQEL